MYMYMHIYMCPFVNNSKIYVHALVHVISNRLWCLIVVYSVCVPVG